jgi:cardiolipin synthase
MMHPMMVFLSLAYVTGEWLIRITALFTVTHRRQPAAALAWLAVIFFHPWIGLILYVMMGESSIIRRRANDYSEKAKAVDALLSFDSSRFMPPDKRSKIFHPIIDKTMQPLAELTEKVGKMPVMGGNDIQLISETVELVNCLISDIDAAQHHVHLLYYIFENDETGRKVADALIRAVGRGIKVRLIADAIGSKMLFKTGLSEHLIQSGVLVYPLFPVKFFRSKLRRIDLRNHRKLTVIDGKIAYTGSHNIINASYGHKNMEWDDVSVKIRGAAVLNLQQVFLTDWYCATDELIKGPDIFPAPRVTGDVVTQVIPSGPVYPNQGFQNVIVAAIHVARRHVIFTSPYLAPDEPSLLALKLAVLRGVQVDMVLPEHSDQIMAGACGRAYYEDLLEAGVNLYLYRPGLIHAKTLSVDDEFGMIGSGNFDIRSFFLNFELNLLFHGAVAAAKIRFQQKQYMASSRRLDLESWRKRPAYIKRLEDAAKLMAPLI